jgi:hypothetical protein
MHIDLDPFEEIDVPSSMTLVSRPDTAGLIPGLGQKRPGLRRSLRVARRDAGQPG